MRPSVKLHGSNHEPLRSPKGQTRTLDNVRVTSVKLLIADSKRTFSYVRSGPQGDIQTGVAIKGFPARSARDRAHQNRNDAPTNGLNLSAAGVTPILTPLSN